MQPARAAVAPSAESVAGNGTRWRCAARSSGPAVVRAWTSTARGIGARSVRQATAQARRKGHVADEDVGLRLSRARSGRGCSSRRSPTRRRRPPPPCRAAGAPRSTPARRTPVPTRCAMQQRRGAAHDRHVGLALQRRSTRTPRQAARHVLQQAPAREEIGIGDHDAPACEPQRRAVLQLYVVAMEAVVAGHEGDVGARARQRAAAGDHRRDPRDARRLRQPRKSRGRRYARRQRFRRTRLRRLEAGTGRRRESARPPGPRARRRSPALASGP